MEHRQKPTIEGLEAEKLANEDKQVVADYKHAMKNFINPARVGVGMSVKKIVED